MEFKNYMKCVAVSFAALGLFSCSSDEADVVSATDPAEIRLSGELSTVSAGTRAAAGAGPITGLLPTVNPLLLDIYRADATGTNYAAAAYATTSIAGSMATDGKITFTPAQFYQADPNDKTKLIGLYPRSAIQDIANKKITYTGDGTIDIMASDLIAGSRGISNVFEDMTFKHLLTQVQVKIVADATVSDVTAAWGKVTGITISGKKENLVVTLPALTGGDATVAGAGSPAALPLVSATTHEPPVAQGLTATLVDYGYAMFLPVDPAGKLTFNITTEKSPTAQELTTTTDQLFEAGKAYVINITFKASGISVTAKLTNWDSTPTPIPGTIG